VLGKRETNGPGWENPGAVYVLNTEMLRPRSPASTAARSWAMTAAVAASIRRRFS
jgi:hypothetical protein